MAIYNIFDYAEKQQSQQEGQQEAILDQVDLHEAKIGFDEKTTKQKKDRFFSSLAARAFFVLLLVVDVLWGLYMTVVFTLHLTLGLLTFFKVPAMNKWLAKSFLNVKRFLVCALALAVAVISPALGIMFACTYFLMYDKEGIEEIVPASLQAQFKEFFQP